MHDYPPVTLPIIHRNGDRKEVLVERLEHAYDAISDALNAVAKSAPNGRNYYPVPGSMEKAIAQHDARILTLHNVMLSIEAEIIGIQDLA